MVGGYCAYASAGDLDETIWQYDIDFLAVEESLVSNRLVAQARELGLRSTCGRYTIRIR